MLHERQASNRLEAFLRARVDTEAFKQFGIVPGAREPLWLLPFVEKGVEIPKRRNAILKLDQAARDDNTAARLCVSFVAPFQPTEVMRIKQRQPIWPAVSHGEILS